MRPLESNTRYGEVRQQKNRGSFVAYPHVLHGVVVVFLRSPDESSIGRVCLIRKVLVSDSQPAEMH